MRELIVSFVCHGDIEEVFLDNQDPNMLMGVKGAYDVSPTEALCASFAFSQYAIGRFTRTARERGISKRKCNRIIKEISKNFTEEDAQ